MARQSPPGEVLPSAAPGPVTAGHEPFSEQDIRALVGTAAVEKGIRRALTDDALRPSTWEVLRRQQQRDRDW